MSFRAASVSLCLLLGAASAAPVTSTAWRVYRSAAGGFRVLAPGQFSKSKQVIPSAGGGTAITTYDLKTPGYHFTVVYSDFPKRNFTAADVEGLVRDAIPQVTHGHAATPKRITVAGVAGREFAADYPKSEVPRGSAAATLKGRIFFVKDRMYQVAVVVFKPAGTIATADRYLQSFRFTP